jgi:hypothetical protein
MPRWSIASIYKLQLPLQRIGRSSNSKANKSENLTSYLNLSYLSKAMGKTIDRLDTLRD